MEPSTRSALAPFLILFAALYAGFGVQSPYLPAFLDDRGLRPEAIGMVLAAGTAVRLAAGPAAGRLADRLDAAKLVFAGCAAAAALMALLYLPAQGSILQAAALAPLAPLCDTLALGAAVPARRDDAAGPGFDYGWVRGAGSGAFIVGLVLSGQVVGRYSIAAVIWLNAALLAAAALCAPRVRQLPPRPVAPSTAASPERGSVVGLFRLRQFRRVVLVAALILGSHAMHDSFAVIRWGAAGIGPGAAGHCGPSQLQPRWWCSSSSAGRCWTVWARRLRRRWPRRPVWCAGRSRRRQLGSPPWQRYSRSTG